MRGSMEHFEPYVSSKESPKEFSLKAIILGSLLGALFGVGNAYLGLKVGTTVSASIPAAVLSMVILKTFFRKVTILEHNMVQTIAAVGEGLAAGVIFTVPALFLLGAGPSNHEIFLLSLLGGILGILFMIPMRRYIIVKEHGSLPFPEGTACAEILKSGHQVESQGTWALLGILVGAVYKFGMSVLSLWNETISLVIKPFHKTTFGIDCTPSLLGVGYIIGPKIAAYMFAGGLMGWYIFIPLFAMLASNQVIFPGTIPLNELNADGIWANYIRYIGAGCVAFGGMTSLIKIFPLLQKTFVYGFQELFSKIQFKDARVRTDQDISMRWLLLGSFFVILFLWLYPSFPMNLLTIVLLVILGYFFVAVTSITCGLVGSSSNPVSGMTITTLLITCLIFLSLGWTQKIYLIAAITMSCVANVAIALAATTSQDLKTGFLLGATPKYQQIGELIGLILPCLLIGGTLVLLDKAYGFGSKDLPAPQASLMAMIAKGVIFQQLPMTLFAIGLLQGLILFLLGVPILPFAIGLYLPLSLSSPIMLGGMVAFLVKKLTRRKEEAEQQGILISSGLVAGDTCIGVLGALLTVLKVIDPNQKVLLSDQFSLAFFVLLAILLFSLSLKAKKIRKLKS
jgi:putative OPT family oligopeptide transporter